MCGVHVRSDFSQSLLWEVVVVLKNLIFYSFYFVRSLVVLRELIFTVSPLGECGVLERTDFQQFLLWEGLVVLN